MHPQPEPLEPPGAFKVPRKLPAVRGAFQRFTAATLDWTAEWSQTDEWAKKYCSKTNAVAPTEDNALVEQLRIGTGEEFEEDVLTFFQSNLSSRVLKGQAKRVKSFCDNAYHILDSAASEGINTVNSQNPTAWVSDRDWYPGGNFGRVLNRRELYAVLRKKPFVRSGQQVEIGPPRRIYVNKPDGASVMAIIRTTPPSQVPGFQELLANYITASPKPVIRSREMTWWGARSFIFFFSLPFFAISTQDLLDTRSFFNGQVQLRRRYDLSFLKLGGREPEFYDEDDAFRNKPYLVEAVYSVVVTGRSDKYWAAACFNDDFFDNTDDQRLSSEDDTEHVAGSTDPITFKEEGKTESPRGYALAALASIVLKVADYHKDIEDRFEASLNRHQSSSRNGPFESAAFEQIQDWRKKYLEVLDIVIQYNARIIEKLEHFLSYHLVISSDGLPQHSLWQSVHNEERASQSLNDIIASLYSLRDIDSELRRFLKTCTEARRDRKDDHVKEQANRAKKNQRITFAAFVLGILNLIAQIYACRPQKDSNWLASPGFLILIGGSSVICIVICLVPFWADVSQYLAELGCHMSKRVSASYRTALEQMKCLGDLFCYFRFAAAAVWDILRLRLIGFIFRRRVRRALRRAGRRIPPV
ncbi:hypothetical protein QL093DRAFT_1007450 [Fusarium oxysporum]|nr:hypothetical protein QL093DRAFT_1007450 [Fusarium oxysporum]